MEEIIMPRSAYSKLRDNIGRAERRLNEAIRNETNDLVIRAYINQKKRIHDFKEKLAEQKKKGKFDLNAALEQWKTRKDLSGGKKTALEVEKKRLQSELSGDISPDEIDKIFKDYQSLTPDLQTYYEILMRYSAIKGSYIGQSGEVDKRIEAENIMSLIEMVNPKQLNDNDKENLISHMQELDWAYNARGNRPDEFSGVLGKPVNRTFYQGQKGKSYDFSMIDEYDEDEDI